MGCTSVGGWFWVFSGGWVDCMLKGMWYWAFKGVWNIILKSSNSCCLARSFSFSKKSSISLVELLSFSRTDFIWPRTSVICTFVASIFLDMDDLLDDFVFTGTNMSFLEADELALEVLFEQLGKSFRISLSMLDLPEGLSADPLTTSLTSLLSCVSWLPDWLPDALGSIACSVDRTLLSSSKEGEYQTTSHTLCHLETFLCHWQFLGSKEHFCKCSYTS